MRLQITNHAVERYVKRIAPTLSLAAARALLEAAASAPTKVKTHTGESYWELPDCRAVVKFCRRLRAPVCVTIVPLHGEMFEDDELAEFLEASARDVAAIEAEVEETKAPPLAPTIPVTAPKLIAKGQATERARKLHELLAILSAAKSHDSMLRRALQVRDNERASAARLAEKQAKRESGAERIVAAAQRILPPGVFAEVVRESARETQK